MFYKEYRHLHWYQIKKLASHLRFKCFFCRYLQISFLECPRLSYSKPCPMWYILSFFLTDKTIRRAQYKKWPFFKSVEWNIFFFSTLSGISSNWNSYFQKIKKNRPKHASFRMQKHLLTTTNPLSCIKYFFETPNGQ